MSTDYYLEDHPPKVAQFRWIRRAKPTGCTVLHVTDSILDKIDPDTGAENVAKFIANRTDPGSYHRLGDRDSIIPMMPFAYEAFQDGTGSNRFAIGLSLAMRPGDWVNIDTDHRDDLLNNIVEMAVEAHDWLLAEHKVKLVARRITKAQSDAGMSGFIPHSDRDPAQRKDPGAGFPWDGFLSAFAVRTNQKPILTGAAPMATKDQSATVAEIQRVLVNEGINIGTSGPGKDGIDGDAGPPTPWDPATGTGSKTLAGVHQLKNRATANAAAKARLDEITPHLGKIHSALLDAGLIEQGESWDKAAPAVAGLVAEVASLKAIQQDDEGRIHELEGQLEAAQQDQAGAEADLDAARDEIAELERARAAAGVTALDLFAAVAVLADPHDAPGGAVVTAGLMEQVADTLRGREGS